MKNLRLILGTAAVCLSLGLSANTPVDLSKVTIDDGFWNVRLERYRSTTLPHCMSQLERGTGDLHLFDKTGEEGEEARKYISESDVYKVIEGIAYSLATHPDAALEAKADAWIAKIAAMQDTDGYINVADNRWRDPSKRWVLMDNHEMYCAGHLMEAAVAYHRATGKDALLNVARRMADHMLSLFGPGKRIWIPGHPEVETALCRLSEETGEKKYAELAQWFIEERGQGLVPEWDKPFHLDVVPCSQLTDAEGHAVRALFLFCGMADVMTELGNNDYTNALNNMWTDVTERHMYVTGGIGSSAANEGFSADYDLPNKEAYCESCASMALIFWAKRMYARNPDGKYLDVLERTLYNAMLAGISLEGNKFFYVNPLETDGSHHRQTWYGVPCCPNQFARVLPNLGGYIYSSSDDAIWVNLFIGSEATMPDGNWKVKQTGGYPYAGNIEISLAGPAGQTRDLRVHIPSWCKKYTAKVNGSAASAAVEKGFAVFKGCKSGDKVSLVLDMPVVLNHADERVLADKGKVTLSRGPLVYCVEECDNYGNYDTQLIEGATTFSEQAADATLCGAVPVVANSAGNKLKFVPYYAWDNRTAGRMKVWIDERNVDMFGDIKDLVIVGDPTGWSPRPTVKTADHVFTYYGKFTGGDGVTWPTGCRFFASANVDNWSAGPFVRAEVNPTLLDPWDCPERPVEYNETNEGGDKPFYISREGEHIYRITFNLAQGKVSISDDYSGMPIYAVGSASPANDGTEGTWWGWVEGFGHELPTLADDPYVYVMQWYLNEAEFRFVLDKTHGGNCYVIMPVSDAPNEIGEAGLAESPFDMGWQLEKGEKNWKVTKAGYYRVLIDMRDMKLSAEYLGDEHPADLPIEAKNVYMVGDGISWTPGEIALDSTDDPYVFTITRTMAAEQRFRFSTINHFGLHLCATEADPVVSDGGVYVDVYSRAAGTPFTISNAANQNWKIREAGEYDFAVDLRNHSISVMKHVQTGVDTVTVADETAPVEYYNLQGMRIDNPRPGQILIRRQGNVTKKVIL